MITRNAFKYLEQWAESEDRMPLILRGARQVGKTTLVNEFAKKFDLFLSLNLDKREDNLLFEQFTNIEILTDSIYRHCKKQKKQGRTLLFIDEIQSSPKAVASLRYFYEEKRQLHVICAGSLLESLIDKHISFPVGRVEHLAIRPCSFLEFLNGIGEDFDFDLVNNLNVSNVHNRVTALFKNFTIVGGMPAAINKYAVNRDVLAADKIYETLLNTYLDDIEKYARNESMGQIIRYILKYGWNFAAERVIFERFGNSNYKSREVGEAFHTIEKAMLLELVYPVTSVQIPLLTATSHRPKLLWFDTGLVNYIAGVRESLFSVTDVMDAWRGRIAEQIVAQELLSFRWQVSAHRQFWDRPKTQSSAEVDFVIQYKNWAIPIEVKSGHNARLKSLHLYMEEAPHDIAVRVWSKPISVDVVKTPNGKKFKLINVPFYYVCLLEKVMEKYI
jgi:predicted AAA+ superfamily ATPase